MYIGGAAEIEDGYLFEFARDKDPVGLPASKVLLNFRVASGLSPGLGYGGGWDRAQDKACALQAAFFEHLPSAAYVASKESSDHPPNLIVSRCQRFPKLWADYCEVGEGLVFVAAAVRAEWGWGFAYTIQVCLNLIYPFHTFQPYYVFSRSATLDNE